jgi:signal transduction histidine kinase
MDFPARGVLGKSLLRFPTPLILFLIAATGLVAAVPGLAEIVGTIGMVVGQITAGFITLRRSQALDRSERRAWRYLAGGMFLVGAGVSVVSVWSLTVGNPPAFGIADIFFVGAYALLIVTLISLARLDPDGANWTTTLLDALVGGVALAALVWIAFFQDLMRGFGGAQWWEPVIGFLYPVLDIAVVIGVMVLVIRRSHFHLDIRLVFLGLAMAVQVLADFMYFGNGVGRTFAEAQPPWPLNLLATTLLLITASLIAVTPAKREFPETSTPIWALLWPYLLAGALLVTHVVRYRSGEVIGDDTVLLDALLVIVVLIFFRQVFEIHRQRKRVEEQRSELVASVSHELRTPLTAMVGYMTLLDDNADEFPRHAQAQMISEATAQARHMSRLVNDLVMLARGQMKSLLPLEINAVAISEIVSAALQDIDGNGTQVEAEIDHEAIVNIDPDRIRQLMVNLLSNAVRYGGRRVRLVVRTEEHLEIEVHDDGAGVPTRYQEMIWDRFERGAHRLDAKAPGLGIGLSIVKAVAESHGGRALYRQSEVLGGACFSVVIPGAVAARPPSPQRMPVPS